jgi:geranyl-CoA carboxylase alpha subunit
VKATAGGGGRGMRLVAQVDALQAAVESARSEALAAFGSGELLLERALLRPRHVEVQIFADAHGNCIHLGERDCSVQRRHQKLVEETPSPAVDAALRERMGRCAVELALAAGYVGAGTVEFLVEDSAGGNEAGFFLMEMNTRLQVEHPVTEAVTGLDLVEWQIRVARGEALPLRQDEVRFDGHAIEVRLCAEDESYTPQTGTVRKFVPPGGNAGLRFDHALFEGLEVSPYYDSMLGKLIVHAEDRATAVTHLASALDRLVLLGVPTNRRLLAACLRDPVFAAGDALIPFLAERGAALREALAHEEAQVLKDAARLVVFPSGEAAALPAPFVRPARLRHRGALIECRLQETGERAAAGQAVPTAPHKWHVQCGAVDLLLEDASFEPPAQAGDAAASGELRAPFNGKIVALKASAGQGVRRGETLVVLESMKLEHSLGAVRDGVVESLLVEVGQQVGTGQVLARMATA